MRQFSSFSDTLLQISAELPGVPNQINKKKLDVERTLQGAVNQMSDRNQRGALIASRESLGGVNDLASMVASLIDQLMNQQNNRSEEHTSELQSRGHLVRRLLHRK